jgi:ribonuclease P protein component
MLKKENRLKNKRDFDNVFKKGKGARNDFFALKISISKTKDIRVGISVSLKVSKKAVVRNQIKRRISEAVKSSFDKIKPGIDLVFVVMPTAEGKNFEDIKKAVEDLLIKVKAFK